MGTVETPLIRLIGMCVNVTPAVGMVRMDDIAFRTRYGCAARRGCG